jgi:hypothetical protein
VLVWLRRIRDWSSSRIFFWRDAAPWLIVMRRSSPTAIVAAIFMVAFSGMIFASSGAKFTVGSTWAMAR